MVYFVQEDEDVEDGFIKIGYANSLYGYHGRLEKIQVGNPRQLEVIATIPGDKINSKYLEKQIKEKLQDFHIRGEWYSPDPEVFEYIANIQGILLHISRPEWKDCNIVPYTESYGDATDTW